MRDIPIDAHMVRMLKIWKLQAVPNERDLVFARPDGQPIYHPAMLEAEFWPALKRAGLRHVTFHSLRHSYASGLILHGAKMTEVQHRLGHRDVSITMKVYAHWYRDADSGAAEAYTATLFGTDTK